MPDVARIWREYSGRQPSAIEAAEMSAFVDEPEYRLRAVFERTKRYKPRNPWAYARAALEATTVGQDDAAIGAPHVQTLRKNVLCDHCGKPSNPDWMTIEQYWAYCRGCIDLVRATNARFGSMLEDEYRKRREHRARTGAPLYSPSAIAVAEHFEIPLAEAVPA